LIYSEAKEAAQHYELRGYDLHHKFSQSNMRKNLSYIVLAPKSLRNLYNSSSCTDTHSTWEIKDSNIVSCSANLTSAKRLPYKGYFLHQEYNHFKDE